MQEQEFDWRPDKAKANLKKHGVDFIDAQDVFRDTLALIEPDDDPDEQRWRITGLARSGLLFVVYTERDGDVIRIISARKANKREQRGYFRPR